MPLNISIFKRKQAAAAVINPVEEITTDVKPVADDLKKTVVVEVNGGNCEIQPSASTLKTSDSSAAVEPFPIVGTPTPTPALEKTKVANDIHDTEKHQEAAVEASPAQPKVEVKPEATTAKPNIMKKFMRGIKKTLKKMAAAMSCIRRPKDEIL